MGRGLSGLQKDILRLAHENHVSEQRELPRFRVQAYCGLDGEPPKCDSGNPHENIRVLEAAVDVARERAMERLRERVQDVVPPPLRWLHEGMVRRAMRVVLIAGTFEEKEEAQRLGRVFNGCPGARP